MYDVLHLLVGLDEDAIRTTAELRWRPATGMLVLVSAWWVKGPLLVAAGWASDLRHRRVVPLVALAATVSFALAAWMNAIVKALVGRSRPPDEIGLHAATTVPGSPSFPSGHSMSAFAVATAIALLAPRMRWPVLGLAALIAFSRVYLGVHYPSDVAAGALIGLAVATAVQHAR